MASISMGLGLALAGGLGAAGSITSGIMGSNAAKTAAGEQVNAENNALDFQKQIWSQEQQNASPYLSAGSTSLGNLMTALSNGTFGAGSNASAPTFNQTFTAPTQAEAQATPGYQFTAQQGSKGVLEGAAAAGGAISGGTLKALDTYNTGLANSTYNDVFNRSLAAYNTGLSAYQANLQGYQANLQNQAQQYNQMLAPVQLGENAATNLNNQGQAVATNTGNLMTGIGNAQASGTVGSSNALTGGITGATNSLLQGALLNQILGKIGNSSGVNIGATGSAPISSGIGPG
jgi:hypothetical protein